MKEKLPHSPWAMRLAAFALLATLGSLTLTLSPDESTWQRKR